MSDKKISKFAPRALVGHGGATSQRLPTLAPPKGGKGRVDRSPPPPSNNPSTIFNVSLSKEDLLKHARLILLLGPRRYLDLMRAAATSTSPERTEREYRLAESIMADLLDIYPPDSEETRLARLYQAFKRAVLNGQPLQGDGDYVGHGVRSTSKHKLESAPPRGLGRVERLGGAAKEWRGEVMGFSDWQIEQVFGEAPSDEQRLRRLAVEEEVRLLAKQGFSVRQIADRLPIHKSRVQQILSTLKTLE